jgi:endonuclease YncB( thermonuclease family)
MHFRSPQPVVKSAREPAGDMALVVPGSVHDGDTLRVRRGTEEIKVRFCGIDAPELAQPLGVESRDYLRRLLGDGSVRLVEVERDRYGRMVGEVFLLDGRSVNVEMVRAGMAYHYAKYSGNCGGRWAIGLAENEARSRSIGIWANDYQKPWDYRKTNTNKNSSALCFSITKMLGVL